MGRPKKIKTEELVETKSSPEAVISISDQTGQYLEVAAMLESDFEEMTKTDLASKDCGFSVSAEELEAIRFLIHWTGVVRRKSNDRAFRAVAQSNMGTASVLLARLEELNKGS